MTNPLIGVWRLITVEDHQEDGTILYPYGEQALGYLIYHPEGYMSATVMSAERPRIAVYSRPFALSYATQNSNRSSTEYLYHTPKLLSAPH